MKALVGIILALAAQSALAIPCFHAGTYEGQGNGYDENNKPFQYEVTSVFSDSNNEVSNYKYSGGTDQYTIQVNGNAVTVNSGQYSGTIECGLTTEKMTAGTSTYGYEAETTFIGNYLLRSGTVNMNGKTLPFREILYRTK